MKLRALFKNDDGYAVAEFAVVIPALLSVLGLSLWLIAISLTKIELQNYANNAARLIARGETSSAEFLAGAPSGMELNVTENENQIRVLTQVMQTLPIFNKQIQLTSEATALSEVYVYQE